MSPKSQVNVSVSSPGSLAAAEKVSTSPSAPDGTVKLSIVGSTLSITSRPVQVDTSPPSSTISTTV